jgi:hypothetical protein
VRGGGELNFDRRPLPESGLMRVMDLPGWPPQPGGSKTNVDTVALPPDQVTIERVVLVVKDHVLFACQAAGRSVLYDFRQLNRETSKELADILNENMGRSLQSIARMPLPEDDD